MVNVILYSPSMWSEWTHVSANVVAVDDRCVNEGAMRADGTLCRERAEDNGWCEACAAELFPPGWATRSSGRSS